jgi:hypothetical protein
MHRQGDIANDNNAILTVGVFIARVIKSLNNLFFRKYNSLIFIYRSKKAVSAASDERSV